MYIRILFILTLAVGLQAKINIVASTTDLADIASQIGGEEVTTLSIARGSQDPHYIEVLPSFMFKVRRADVYLKVGMELDQWADQIIAGSRNRKLQVIDCSANINPVEVPTGKVDASMGDIHPHGNPHYWLNPENGREVARTIAASLIARDPAHADLFQKNLAEFEASLTTLEAIWDVDYADLRGQSLIYYHNTWPYFNQYFGLTSSAFVEPKPGIMPTPNHLDNLIHLIQGQNISVIAMEPYFSRTAPEFLARKTGVTIVQLAQSVGARKGVDSYQEMLAYNLEAIQRGLQP